MERPAGPDNRDFPGLLGAEVERDFQGRAGRKGLVPPEGWFQRRDSQRR